MGVSEREEKNLIVCCGEKIETHFCPHCGNSLKNVEQLHSYRNRRPYIKFPHKFEVCLHGDTADPDIRKMLEELYITKDDEIYEDIRGCAYEVKLEYEITARDGEVNLIAVDGQILKRK